MTPIFFPFTYIPPGRADALRACFSQLTVLQPGPGCLPADMEQMAASGWLDVRLPAGVDGGQLQAVIKEYRGWAEVHQGRRGVDSGFLRTLGSRPPFFEETAPSRIRDAIRGQEKAVADGNGAPNLLPDLIFLRMAQEFDAQSQSVHADLEDVVQMEAELFGQLRGEGDGIRSAIAAAGARAGAAPGEYMLPERLAAWSRLLTSSLSAESMPPAAITTSLAVIEYLREQVAGFKEMGRIEPIALGDQPEESMLKWHRELSGVFQTLATGGEADAAGMPDPPVSTTPPTRAAASLTVYIGSGMGLTDFLAAAVGDPPPEPIRNKTINTVIGLVQVAGTLNRD